MPDIVVPLGGRLVIAALTTGKTSAATEAALSELVDVLDAWDGAGAFVWTGAPDGHARFDAALRAFAACDGRRVVVLDDANPSLDVAVETGAGARRVAVRMSGSSDDAHRLMGEGFTGLVAAQPEPCLNNFGPGFFAATGVIGETHEPREARFGLRDVVVPTRVASWVEVEAGADVHARLWYSHVDIPGASVYARTVMRREEAPERPARVAVFPAEESWPEVEAQMVRPTRVRRRAAALIAIAGVFDIASAITPPLESRLKDILQIVPLAVPQAATLLVTLAGLGLLALARGVRRGQERAYRVALALLVGSTVLHLVKGVDVEEASTAAAVAGYLYLHRDVFRTRGRDRAIRHGLRNAAGAFAATVVTVSAMFEVVTAAKHHRITIPQAFIATLERMIGVTTVKVPDRVDDFATPALVAFALGFVFWIAWQAIQPAAARRGSHDEYRRARTLVERYGAGTLDYFALRADKEFFFARESVVAYAVHQSVCLVSPDPIGPAWERDAVWDDFRRFADGQGWSVGLLGAGEDWLPIYRRSGMHDLYVGDEAVVDVTRFSLDGGRNKGLRQARNRIANHGYAMTFHDPANADDGLRASVEAVMGKSRRGDVERGFSMTLGRIFDRDDRGLLLAVCRDGEGSPVAFCQYVPAPGINGYSLDLMRRDAGEHPNGLLEFVLVETILHLAERGYRKLGLNFATMRAVLAGETGAGITTRVERWALKRMSGSMQIESLWRFNAKFDPEWQPRYAVYDTTGNIVPVAFAIARAESWWELPLLGRFLMPPAPTERVDAP